MLCAAQICPSPSALLQMCRNLLQMCRNLISPCCRCAKISISLFCRCAEISSPLLQMCRNFHPPAARVSVLPRVMGEPQLQAQPSSWSSPGSPATSQDLLALSLLSGTNAGFIFRWTVPSCLFPTCSLKWHFSVSPSGLCPGLSLVRCCGCGGQIWMLRHD